MVRAVILIEGNFQSVPKLHNRVWKTHVPALRSNSAQNRTGGREAASALPSAPLQPV